MRTVKWFFSYAHADRPLVDRFREALALRLGIVKGMRFEGWHDGDLGLGDAWLDGIRAAVRECDVGVLAVSPAFLASRFIASEELPVLLGPGGRRVIPAVLRQVDVERHELHGLHTLQMWRPQGREFPRRRSVARDRWVDGLVDRIVDVAERDGVGR